MKKILAVVLASLMLLSLTACAGSSDTNSTNAPESAIVTPSNLKEGSVGTAIWNDFEKYVTENPTATADEIAQALVDAQQNHEVPLNMGVMPVEEGYLSGLFSDDNYVETTGFESGATFMPWIGSIAFIGYVFELDDAADVDAFIATLEKNANPRWNICVEANETIIGAVDTTVLFVMTPGVYGEDLT